MEICRNRLNDGFHYTQKFVCSIVVLKQRIISTAILFFLFMYVHGQPLSPPFSEYKAEKDVVYYLTGMSGVILDSQRVEGVDINTFQIFHQGHYIKDYAKDKNNVYYQGKIVDNANAETFNLLFANDRFRQYVYCDSTSVFDHGKKLVNVDRKTIKQIGQYLKDKDNVYRVDFQVYDGVDANSFELIVGGSYYRDKKQVYNSFLEVIPNADPASIRYLKHFGDLYSEQYLIADKENVFCHKYMLKGADPNTIQVVENTKYCFKDKNQVYFHEKIIEGAHPDSVFALKDRNAEGKYLDAYIGHGSNVINLAYTRFLPKGDSKTFYKVDDYLYADKNNFYNFYSVCENGNPNNFIRIRWHYILSDGKLYEDNLTEKLIPENFEKIREFIDRGYIELYSPYHDNNEYRVINENLYYGYDDNADPILKNVEINELAALGPYLKSNKHVFFKGKKIKDVDVATFEWLEHNKARDRNSYYDFGVVVR